jgi:hypothetical protein
MVVLRSRLIIEVGPSIASRIPGKRQPLIKEYDLPYYATLLILAFTSEISETDLYAFVIESRLFPPSHQEYLTIVSRHLAAT